MKMKNFMAIAIAATMLALVGCGNTNDSSSTVADVPDSTEAATEATEAAATTEAETTANAETTTTAPPNPFADGIETPIDGVRLGMHLEDITAKYGQPIFQHEQSGLYHFNTDSVTVFGETYNTASVLCFNFDSEGYLSEVTFALGMQEREDSSCYYVETYTEEQGKADFDKIYATICEKAGEPTGQYTNTNGTSGDTWTSDDLETNPTEYQMDIYRVSFYIVSDTSSKRRPFSSLLPQEPVKATETTIAETTEPDEPAGDSMAFADMADAIDKAMSAHMNDPADTADNMLALCRATIEDLKANGLPLGEFTGDPETYGLDENGESAHEWENGDISASVWKMPASTLSVSDIEGITLRDADSFRMITTDVNCYSVGLTFDIGDNSLMTHKACENIFSYFIENGYTSVDSDDLEGALHAAQTTIGISLDRTNCTAHAKNDKFDIWIYPDTQNGTCEINFDKLQ